MSIQYFEHKDIDKSKWDACIANSMNGNIFAYSFYLDSVCENWDALVEGDYESVFPLTWKKKFGILYVYHPFFLYQLGVFSLHKITEETVNRFLDNIPSKYKYIDVSLHYESITNRQDYTITPRESQYLDLNNSYDSIQNNYSENLKRNLKKAERSGVRIVQHVKPEEIVHSFRMAQGEKLNQFNEKDYLRLTDLIQQLIQKGFGQTVAVYSADGKLAANAAFMQSHNRITYLKGAATATGKETGAMPYLMDFIIRENAGKNLIFDFGGSVVQSLARFNKSFGAKDYVYLHLTKNNLSWYMKWLKK